MQEITVTTALPLPTTAPSKPLYPYQAEAIDRIKTLFASGKRRVLLALPTGTGKTRTFVELIRAYFDHDQRVLVLVHRDELVNQTVATIRAQIPEAEIGIVKAEKHEVDAPIVIASIQTLARQ